MSSTDQHRGCTLALSKRDWIGVRPLHPLSTLGRRRAIRPATVASATYARWFPRRVTESW